eukprot:2330240-Prymnesium_polylepis.3
MRRRSFRPTARHACPLPSVQLCGSALRTRSYSSAAKGSSSIMQRSQLRVSTSSTSRPLPSFTSARSNPKHSAAAITALHSPTLNTESTKNASLPSAESKPPPALNGSRSCCGAFSGDRRDALQSASASIAPPVCTLWGSQASSISTVSDGRLVCLRISTVPSDFMSSEDKAPTTGC